MASAQIQSFDSPINYYVVCHYSDSESKIDSAIFLRRSAGSKPVAVLMFYRPDPELPESYVWEEQGPMYHVPHMVLHTDQFPNVISTLRKERPLRFVYDATANRGTVMTGYDEPIGEEESRLVFFT